MGDALGHTGSERVTLRVFMVLQRGHLMVREMNSPSPSLREQLPQRISCIFIVTKNMVALARLCTGDAVFGQFCRIYLRKRWRV